MPTLQPTAVSPLSTIPFPTNEPTVTSEFVQSTAVATSTIRPSVTSQAVVESTAVPATATSPPPRFQPTEINTQFQQIAQTHSAEFVTVLPENSGFWRWPAGQIGHPIGLARTDSHLYMLDLGKLIQIERGTPNNQVVLLTEDDVVDNIPVIELIDMALVDDSIFALDRAGDVYRFYILENRWELDWYGRQLEESAGHYYTAVSGLNDNRLLLESSYQFVQRYGAAPRIWPISEALGVDVVEAEATYVLQQSLSTDEGFLVRYSDARTDTSFAPDIKLERVRQLAVTETAVYILDWQGERVVKLDKSGKLQAVYQTPSGTTAFLFEQEQLVFAGSQGVIWHNRPAIQAQINSTLSNSALSTPLSSFSGLSFELPIQNTNLTSRPLQMPGAPRHYRLGVHEGLDFYWRTGTALYAVDKGVIVRADLDYETPSAADFLFWEEETARLGKTSDNALNFYRGRQLWIEHQNGIITRYAHLSAIAPELQVGDFVTRGQLIGEVGNSGSPVSIDGPNGDAHLHLEIWLDDLYLGQYLRPVESWELIKQIFGK
ncbi:MAG: M23 family metallopeptidase [Chloroflexota bacterium]